MTQITEFDRVLGEWLDQGPNRAPDRSIELALDHARSHPRRRDPLAFLRPDPMGRRSGGLALGLRPVMTLTVLGLLLAAVAALGIGGRQDPAVVPPAQPSVTPVPSVTPMPASPSATPGSFHVDLTVPVGQPQTVDIVDRSALVLEATSGTPDDGQGFPFDAVEVSNLDATTLQLAWAGYPCKTDHTLTIEPDGRTMVLDRPDCEGVTDTIAVNRILVLTFSEPVAAAEVAVSLVP